MTIWVDADACPVVIKEMLYRAAERSQINTYFVANQMLKIPPSRFLHTIRVASGFDVADNEIVKLCEPQDLVITSDIPLAADVIAKQALALSPRGELFTRDNIGERLNLRDFFDTLRASGIQSGGPDAINQKDKQAFAGQLDKYLHQHANKP
ncbi:MAG: YaiI/YqxD family protein [Shewanella sp.]|uniref:YaiI/YqxD family protein n=1 Tax=Shewanella sp. SNU WT4 TaxID=2590015 RepID=UPI0011275153|nr:YaiI/YqxD family protein [Shewanella sp. SNU WT4]QDF67276.1 YaiI/YqxD family protein [Shewanella sp. SNU WT4]